MEKRQTGILIESLGMIVLGLVVWILIPYQINLADSANEAVVNPQSIPKLLVVVMILSGIFHLRKYFTSQKASDARNHGERSIARLIPGILILVVYLALMPILGFMIATFLNILGFIYLMGRPSWYKALPVALISSVILWVIFYQLLNVPLPTGFLGI